MDPDPQHLHVLELALEVLVEDRHDRETADRSDFWYRRPGITFRVAGV